MEGYEDISRNVFYLTLREEHNDVWQRAIKNGWFVCIPQKSSLRGIISRKEFENHVLQPSKSFPGEFLTLNGRTVNIVGNEIVTKAGFPEARTSKILYSEEYVSEQCSDHTCHLLHLGRPLEGGVDAPCGTEEMNRTVIQKIVAMLKSYPEHESIFLRLRDFVEETKQYFDFRSGRPLHPKFEDFVRYEMQYACETLLNSSCFRHLKSKLGRKKQRAQLSQVLESYIMDGIHDVVFQWVAKHEEDHDIELTRILQGMSTWTQHDLGMRIEFQCPQEEAVGEFQQLTACTTPLEKMLCLNKTHDLINRGVEKNLTSRYLDIGAHQMTTDDLLDQLIFVIIRAAKSDSHGRSHLAANIKYMQRFHLLNVNTTVLGYNQANLEVAIGWFLLKRRQVERPLWADNDNAQGSAGNGTFVVPSGLNQQNQTPRRRRRRTSGGDAAAGGHAPPPSPATNLKKSPALGASPSLAHETRPCEGLLLGVDGMAESGHRNGEAGASSVGEAVQVACGGQFFVKLDSKGYVWTWGVPNCGRLGWHGVEESSNSDSAHAGSLHRIPPPTFAMDTVDGKKRTTTPTSREKASMRPKLIPSLRSVFIVEISCGTHHTVVRAANGILYAWGDNRYGQLGVGTTECGDSNHPIKVDLTDCPTPKISTLSCGSSHSLAITSDGAVISWGNGGSGRLGNGSTEHVGIPTVVKRTVDGVNLGLAVSVEGGWNHSLVVLHSGSVFAWGCGADGRLGVGSYSDQLYPCRVLFFGSKPAEAGPTDNVEQEIGETPASPSSFEQVDDMFYASSSAEAYSKPAYALAEREPPLDLRIVKVSAGYAHTIFLSSNGKLFATGCGMSGQLGIVGADGKPEAVSLVPRPITIEYSLSAVIVDIACGDHHTACLTAGGKLLAWGLNKGNPCGLDSNDPSVQSPSRGGAGNVVTGNSVDGYPLEQTTPTVSSVFKDLGRKPVRLGAGPSSTSIIVKMEK